MLLELMSNGKLARLPYEDNISKSSNVVLLLPHNRYLIGKTDKNIAKWFYSGDEPEIKPQNVSLYDNQDLYLSNGSIIPADSVNALKKELMSLTDPPGEHNATIMMLRTFMHGNKIFQGLEIPNEETLKAAMKEDEILKKAYWTLRFALSHNELETVRRLKAWLSADPKIFSLPKNIMKIWFTLLEMPDDNIINELNELSFSKIEIARMSQTHLSPVVLYKPETGWLILARFGKESTMFISWIYLTHELYHEMRERKKMTLNDMVYALWGEYETQEALKERSKYKGAEEE